MKARFNKRKSLFLLIALIITSGSIGFTNLFSGYHSNSNSIGGEMNFPNSSNPTSFLTTWNTSLISSGSSDASSISLPLITGGIYDFWIDWDDGTPLFHYTTYDVIDHTHKYTSAGVYDINITGTIAGWNFGDTGDKLKLLEVKQWGNLLIGNDGGYFYGCQNLNITATDELDLSLTSDMSSAFRDCDNLGSNAVINEWDMSVVTDMSYMFYNTDSFNSTIEKWDVSQVTDMHFMFAYSDFDGYIGGWDVSSVTNMYGMFRSADSYNRDLSSWDVYNVIDMRYMFHGATFFNQPLNNWDVSNVTDMDYMFAYASSFNQPLNSWDVASVTDMRYMFFDALSFNGEIGNWVVSNVTYMHYMFWGASTFNRPINGWDVSNVITMLCMFTGAESFNQPLNSWDVSNVIHTSHMFSVASSFDQDLDNWDVSSVEDMTNMFYEATNFNRDISKWDVSLVTGMSRLFSGASSFNQPLNSWIVSNVTDMSYMFWGATSFNHALDSWDVSNVTDMSYMFHNASSFNQPIDSWVVSGVTNMVNMFEYASSFNQSLNSWDVSGVTSMTGMFRQAHAFNQPLNNWVTSSVTSMSAMFVNATAFNQPLNSWDVSSVTTMSAMFVAATSFDHPIDNWDVSSVTTMTNMFLGVTLNSEHYDNLLNAWSLLTLQSGVPFHGGYSKYTSIGEPGRTSIISTFNWGIQDGGTHFTPFPSVLGSNADDPDDDGSFTLSWTDTYTTTNYTVYKYSSPITEINGSLTTLLSETASLSLLIEDLANGTYYYAVASNNEYGSTLSNCIEVEVITYLYISISNPTGSSAWLPDTSQTMSWVSEGDIANVKIELYRGEAFVTEIISNTVNDGEFIWLVPTSLSYSDDYRIKIIDVLNPDTYDYSDYFEIGTPPDDPKKVPGYNLLILFGIIGITGSLLAIKITKFKK